MKRAKAVIVNGLLLLISCVVALAIVEAFVTRYVWYGESMIDRDEPFGRRQSPNAKFSYQGAVFTHDCEHNSDGFRERELPTSPNTAGRRVVFIGDSFTYGWGVNDPHSFVRRTGAMLQQDGGDAQWEVLNLAVFGTHILQYRDILFSYGQQLKPQVVVVCLYLPNDAASWYWPPKRDQRPNGFWHNLSRGYPEHTLQLAANVYGWRKKHPGRSWATSAEENPLVELLQSDDPAVREKVARIDPALREMCVNWELSPHHPAYAITREPDMLAYHIDTNNNVVRKPGPRRALQEMKDEVASWGGELRLVFIPMGWTMEPAEWTGFEQFGYTMRPALLNDRRTIDSFAHFAEELGIEYLDLRPHLQDQPARCYLDLDDHFTVFGHRQVAHVLAPWLRGELKDAAPPLKDVPAMPTMQEMRRWNFGGASNDWTADGATAERKNGALSVRYTTPNAVLRNANAVLDCSQVNRLRVRMKADNGVYAALYWGKAPDAKTGKDAFSEHRAAVFPIVADNAFHDYDIALDHAVADYSGAWTGFEFYPAAMDKDAGDMTGATVVVDSIALGMCEPAADPPNIWNCAYPLSAGVTVVDVEDDVPPSGAAPPMTTSPIPISDTAPAPAAAPGPQLLLNPSFEEWDDQAKPAQWGGFRTFLARSADAHDGAASVELQDAGPGNTTNLRQTVALPADAPHKRIAASVALKAGDAGKAGVVVVFSVNGEEKRVRTDEHPGDGQWHTLAIDAEVPEGADLANVTLLVYRRDGAQQPVLADTASLRTLD